MIHVSYSVAVDARSVPLPVGAVVVGVEPHPSGSSELYMLHVHEPDAPDVDRGIRALGVGGEVPDGWISAGIVNGYSIVVAP